jgi:hypothetical protein
MFELLHNGAKLGIIFHIKQIFLKKKNFFRLFINFFWFLFDFEME